MTTTVVASSSKVLSYDMTDIIRNEVSDKTDILQERVPTAPTQKTKKGGRKNKGKAPAYLNPTVIDKDSFVITSDLKRGGNKKKRKGSNPFVTSDSDESLDDQHPIKGLEPLMDDEKESGYAAVFPLRSVEGSPDSSQLPKQEIETERTKEEQLYLPRVLYSSSKYLPVVKVEPEAAVAAPISRVHSEIAAETCAHAQGDNVSERHKTDTNFVPEIKVENKVRTTFGEDTNNLQTNEASIALKRTPFRPLVNLARNTYSPINFVIPDLASVVSPNKQLFNENFDDLFLPVDAETMPRDDNVSDLITADSNKPTNDEVDAAFVTNTSSPSSPRSGSLSDSSLSSEHSSEKNVTVDSHYGSIYSSSIDSRPTSAGITSEDLSSNSSNNPTALVAPPIMSASTSVSNGDIRKRIIKRVEELTFDNSGNEQDALIFLARYRSILEQGTLSSSSKSTTAFADMDDAFNSTKNAEKMFRGAAKWFSGSCTNAET
ncbi:hypothetical protein HDU67_001445, partial [Dinochytrium kinnereticum]